MTIFLSIAFALSAAVLVIAHAMEAGAIRSRVSGANGFVLFVALYLSAAGSLGVALLAWIFGSFGLALGVLAFSVIWHITVFKLSARRLQGLIDTDKGPDHDR
jgi:hypothetical protein